MRKNLQHFCQWLQRYCHKGRSGEHFHTRPPAHEPALNTQTAPDPAIFRCTAPTFFGMHKAFPCSAKKSLRLVDSFRNPLISAGPADLPYGMRLTGLESAKTGTVSAFNCEKAQSLRHLVVIEQLHEKTGTVVRCFPHKHCCWLKSGAF